MKSFSQTLTLQTTPAEIWQALVDPQKVARYHLASLKEIELTNDGKILYGIENTIFITGKVTHVEPGRRLDHTFRFLPNQPGTENDPETAVSYLIESTPSGATLTLTHSGFPHENQTYANISEGWPVILQRLKEFLEKQFPPGQTGQAGRN